MTKYNINSERPEQTLDDGKRGHVRVADVDELTGGITGVLGNHRVYPASFSRLRGIHEVIFCYTGRDSRRPVMAGNHGRSRRNMGDQVGPRNERGARSADGRRLRGISLPSVTSLFVFFQDRHQVMQKIATEPSAK